MAHERPSIMVVDDEPGMRMTLEGLIEDEGYDVVGVSDGYTAIELAKTTRFSLIFMDIMMPRINGLETYKEIKKVSPGTIVLMVTGFSVEEVVKQALEEGAYAVIYKPFDVGQVLDIVKDVLKTTFALVVDDRAADRQILRALLEDNGYLVSEAQDGEQAIELARERHYDIILMDIRMPSINGVAAFEQIRKFDGQAKAIFVSGYDLEDSVKDALLAGAHSVLAKPVDPEEMLALIGSITGNRVRS